MNNIYWGPFNNHTGSILLLSPPFTNINLHVKKYDFCSCLGSPGGPVAESKVPKCQRIKTSSQWRHMHYKENDQLFIYGPRCEKNQKKLIFGGPWQCLGEDFNNRIGPISVRIYHLIYVNLHIKYGNNLIFWALRGVLTLNPGVPKCPQMQTSS